MRKKVLFVGSDPNYNRSPEYLKERGEYSIQVQQERTVLEAVYESRDYFDLIPQDLCSWQQFISAVDGHNPSVIHICSHGGLVGDEAVLIFADEEGAGLEVRAAALIHALKGCSNLELLYLDACKSAGLAKAMVAENIQYCCVGFNEDVPVTASTRGSGFFHSKLAAGESIKAATMSLKFFFDGIAKWSDAAPEAFFPAGLTDRGIRVRPTILAKFFKDDPRPDDSGFFTVNLGVRLNDSDGPHNEEDAYLVCFFSDDDDYIEQEYVTMMKDRPGPSRTLWHDWPSKECWDYNEDKLIYCTVVHLQSKHSETVRCTVSNALRRYYQLEGENEDQAASNPNRDAIRRIEGSFGRN